MSVSNNLNSDNSINTSNGTLTQISENSTFDVTTSSIKITEITSDANTINFQRPTITGYNLSKSSTEDLYHRFPKLFDEQIINEGRLYGIHGNSSMYYASGHINGELGIYTIGINNKTGTIYHRCFYPMKRIGSFKFP